MTEKIYHIYFQEKCIYHSLPEHKFNEVWEMIHKFLSITDSDKLEDLTYEELATSRELSLNSSY